MHDLVVNDIGPASLEFYKDGGFIGQGTFGKVKKAQWRGRDVAVKILDVSEEELKKGTFLNELKQQKRAQHHVNVVQLYGARVETGRGRVCIVMEYMENGTLHHLLHNQSKLSYSPGHAINWLRQCAAAVAYLHNNRVVHRDLKPLNLLLSNGYRQLKICDFGTVADLKSTMTNNRGTAAYMAPEVFEGRKYDGKCDVYSFGIITWEVLSRRPPFTGPDFDCPFTILWQVAVAGYRPALSFIGESFAPVAPFIASCWQRDPLRRPTIKECKKQLKRFAEKFPFDNSLLTVVDDKAGGEVGMMMMMPSCMCTAKYTYMPSSSSSHSDDEGIATSDTAMTMTPTEPAILRRSFGCAEHIDWTIVQKEDCQQQLDDTADQQQTVYFTTSWSIEEDERNKRRNLQVVPASATDSDVKLYPVFMTASAYEHLRLWWHQSESSSSGTLSTARLVLAGTDCEMPAFGAAENGLALGLSRRSPMATVRALFRALRVNRPRGGDQQSVLWKKVTGLIFDAPKMKALADGYQFLNVDTTASNCLVNDGLQRRLLACDTDDVKESFLLANIYMGIIKVARGDASNDSFSM